MSLSDAKQMCTANGHAGFTYQPSQQRVWWLKAITNTSGFCDGAGQFDVYLAPSTLSLEPFVSPSIAQVHSKDSSGQVQHWCSLELLATPANTTHCLSVRSHTHHKPALRPNRLAAGGQTRDGAARRALSSHERTVGRNGSKFQLVWRHIRPLQSRWRFLAGCCRVWSS